MAEIKVGDTVRLKENGYHDGWSREDYTPFAPGTEGVVEVIDTEATFDDRPLYEVRLAHDRFDTIPFYENEIEKVA